MKKAKKKAKTRKKTGIVLTCNHNDHDGHLDCLEDAVFVHPDPDGDFYYCAEHHEACPRCRPLR